jgi:hypothetical protein
MPRRRPRHAAARGLRGGSHGIPSGVHTGRACGPHEENTAMKDSRKKRAQRALGAALAGILAGSTLALGCGQTSEASTTEANGCNGPNGCGGEQEQGHESGDANACNGPNGCGGEAESAS